MVVNSKGFSLVELMVTVGIAGIVMALAVPSLSTSLTQNHVTSTVRELSKDLTYARSVAISNQLPVVVCNLSGSTCAEDDWEKGYTIFLDANGNGTFDSGLGDTDVKLRVNKNFDQGLLSLSNGADEIIFRASGRVTSAVVFTYCPNMEKDYVRGVVINQLGRAKLTDDYDGDNKDESNPANSDSHLVCS